MQIQSGVLLFCGSVLAGLVGCAAMPAQPLDVVDFVDIPRYMGKWYEVASYPAPFEAGCVGTTADYTLREDGKVTVLNQCFDQSFEGPVRTIEGTARVVDEQTNAKLKVSFFPPFEADYWIIDLDENYQWAVVGEPSRTFLFILSRTPNLDEATYQSILARLSDQGYDPGKISLTPQS